MLCKDRALELQRFSKQIQMETVKTIASLGTGHVGGALSISDVLAVLYGNQMQYKPQDPRWDDRDWLVVSKGHAGPAVYATLALKGFFPIEQLQTLNQPGTNLPSHCDSNRTPGIDITTGSLGQGASSAAGVALALKMKKKASNVYLILGDGEIEEGQVWEMALFAAHRKLDNLIAFVDNNHLQIDGTVEEVSSMTDIAEKFASFGWYAQNVCGHSVEEIDAAIDKAKAQNGKPSVIVLDTIKGNGWSKIAGKVGSHSCAVTAEDMKSALAEMQAAYNDIGGAAE
ncbi:MAG: transketolase [Eubacteriales bacterium]|nr:transketolase [Eubacteriales bacterium]